MPWPVYTERILSTQTSGVKKHLTVPAGKRIVIKRVTAMAIATGTGYAQLEISGVLAWYRVLPASPSLVNDEILAVAYAGEDIAVLIQTPGMAIATSGFIFADERGAATSEADIWRERSLDLEPLPAEVHVG